MSIVWVAGLFGKQMREVARAIGAEIVCVCRLVIVDGFHIGGIGWRSCFVIGRS